MHVLGTTIDYKKTLAYNGITFDNPMATGGGQDGGERVAASRRFIIYLKLEI